MTTTHHLEKDMPLERLINFLCRYAWFKKTAYFLGKLVCILCWGVVPIVMLALVAFVGYKFIEFMLAFANYASKGSF